MVDIVSEAAAEKSASQNDKRIREAARAAVSESLREIPVYVAEKVQGERSVVEIVSVCVCVCVWKREREGGGRRKRATGR